MFDFFKDVYLEARGIDSDVAKAERDARLEEKKKSRFIFSKGGKLIVFAFGIFYLIVSALNISVLKSTGALTAGKILQIIFLSGCDIACLVCLLVGKKKTEIAALILVIVFVVAFYLLTILI